MTMRKPNFMPSKLYLFARPWSIFPATTPRVSPSPTPGHSFSSRNPVCWAPWADTSVPLHSHPNPSYTSGKYSSSFKTQGRYPLFQHAFPELPQIMTPMHFLWDSLNMELLFLWHNPMMALLCVSPPWATGGQGWVSPSFVSSLPGTQ